MSKGTVKYCSWVFMYVWIVFGYQNPMGFIPKNIFNKNTMIVVNEDGK